MSTPRDESVATEALSPTAADFRQQPDELIRAGELAAGLVDVVYSLRLEPDMEFEFVSPAVEAMVGYTPQEHYDDPQLGMRLLDPRDLDVLMGTVSAAIDEPISMRVRWTAKDGHSVWTDHRCVKRQRNDGSVVLHGAARDVTREHELVERYRLLAENSSDIVTCINSQGQLEWVSASVEHILGWKVEELVVTLPWDILHPDDHAAAAEALTAAVDNPLERVSINLRIKSADGGWRWMSAVGHYAADGLLVTSYRDIEAEQRALAALQESEARYRLLVENATDVVYTVGPDRLVTWIAPTVTHTLGWADSELIGTSMYDLSHEDDRARIDAIREAVFHGEAIPNAREEWPIRFRNKDGTYTWMALKTTTITDDDGQFAFAVTGMRNVDDLVTEERRLAEASARREAILASLLDPHVFLQAVRDDSGQIIDFIYTDANDAACVYNETPRELLIGKSLLELLPGQAGSGLLAMYAHAVESGEPLVLNDYAYPHDILLEERRFDIRAIRVGDGLSHTWRDVTERFEAARRVALSEESFRLLAEHSSDVVLRSRDGVMQWLSPSLTSALGWTPADWIGHRFEEFVHPDDLDLTHATRANINAGASAVTTSRLRDTGDEYHWVEIHGGPAFNSGGEYDGSVASFRVVDKEKRAQQVLAES